MHALVLLSLLAILQSTRAHGDHASKEAETNEQYAARHMSSEHHIDSFDIRSFFHLHDLNRDGSWDRAEIEAIYGVHHVYSQKLSADDQAHQAKADTIVQTVLRNVDKNNDGRITKEELEEAGLNSLPNFKELGAEGHHYDVESEFFLHHEEIYHSTPETQTDESYNHPEDIEHFAMHEQIEAEEEARERRFQGLPADTPSNPSAHDHDHPAPPDAADAPSEPQIPGAESLAPDASMAAHPHDDQHAFGVPEPPLSEPPKLPIRETPPEKQPPEVKYGKAAAEGRSKSEWGQGEDGYKRPKTPADKMRKNLPYKYKFRRNWGDF
ncbi:precursor to secretory protein Ssp120 [Gautieria morchelliformis]|nr:precursor to secretory protein Ssp120 [Gautieria morchelliformis]